MRIKMVRDYGRLKTDAEYEVDDTTGKTLVAMGNAVVTIAVARKKKRRRRK